MRPVVITGASDITVDYKTSEKDSVELAADAVMHAVESMGHSRSILTDVDGILTIPPSSVTMEYSIGVAQRLGLNTRAHYSSINGGSSPIELLNLAAKLISSGWHDFLVIAAGDNIGSYRRNHFNDFVSSIRLTLKSVFSRREIAHGLNLPSPSYALYSVARAAKEGIDLHDVQRSYAAMIADFSRVASHYPPSRLKGIVTPDEVLQSAPVVLPFTKLMCANPQLDQGNALMVMSRCKARALGIGEERLVYVHGGGDFSDHKSTEDEKDFTVFWGAHLAILQALACAGISLDEVESEIQNFDIYSCFPSVVHIISDILGMSFSNFERFTVTGGLPRRGGAGSIYSMSAIAAMYTRLLGGGKGFVYGIGGASSAHSAVVLGKEEGLFSPGATSDELRRAYREYAQIPRVTLDPAPSGAGEIVSYTVIYDNPARGQDIDPYILCMGRSSEGQFIANLEGIEPGRLAQMSPGEVIGCSCNINTDENGHTVMHWR